MSPRLTLSLNAPQVTPHSQPLCTTWTPTSSTLTPWRWRPSGRSFRTTTATRCSRLWASEPNCPRMDGCHMSSPWWSRVDYVLFSVEQMQVWAFPFLFPRMETWRIPTVMGLRGYWRRIIRAWGQFSCTGRLTSLLWSTTWPGGNPHHFLCRHCALSYSVITTWLTTTFSRGIPRRR